jgi:hypothetical protein
MKKRHSKNRQVFYENSIFQLFELEKINSISMNKNIKQLQLFLKLTIIGLLASFLILGISIYQHQNALNEIKAAKDKLETDLYFNQLYNWAITISNCQGEKIFSHQIQDVSCDDTLFKPASLNLETTENQPNLNLPKFVSLKSIISICIALLTLILISIAIILSSKLSFLFSKARERYYEKGYDEGIKHVFLVLDSDNSVFRNIHIWLDQHEKSNHKGDPDLASAIFNQLFTRLENKLQLKQLGEVGEEVTFNIDQYQTKQSGLNPGEASHIIEPGWKLGKAIIRKPLVRKN